MGKEEGLHTKRASRLSTLLGILFIEGVYLAIGVINLHPHWPVSLAGWIILIAIGIPLALALECLSELILQRFPNEGIGILLLVLISVCMAIYFVWMLIGPYIRPLFA